MSEQKPQYSKNWFVRNILQRPAHEVHVVEHAIVHGPGEVISFTEKLDRILKTSEAEYPVIKADYESLKTISIKTTEDGVLVATSALTNVSADVALISDLPTLMAAIHRLATDVEAAYAEINSAAAGAATVAVASTTL